MSLSFGGVVETETSGLQKDINPIRSIACYLFPENHRS
jgi:hypothetical protein